MAKPEEAWTQLATRIPKELHRRLKLYCVTHEIVLMHFVTEAIEEKLVGRRDRRRGRRRRDWLRGLRGTVRQSRLGSTPARANSELRKALRARAGGTKNTSPELVQATFPRFLRYSVILTIYAITEGMLTATPGHA